MIPCSSGHLLLSVALACCSGTIRAQSASEDKFKLELVRILQPDTVERNDAMAVFAVTPIRMEDFPPVLSMGIAYATNGERPEKRVDLMHQEVQRISLTIYGEDLPEKAPWLFDLVKDRIDIARHEAIQFLVFHFRDISTVPIREMSITYGLWEKQDQRKRNERHFRAAVE